MCIRDSWQIALDERASRVADYLLKLQLWLAISLSAALILPSLFIVVLFPDQAARGTATVGSYLGWLSFASITVAAVWFRPVSPWTLACSLFAVSCLVAFNFATISGWAGLHILTLCVAGTAWLMFAAAELTANKWHRTARHVSAIVGSFAVCLSLRGLFHGECSTVWWSIGPLL